MLKILLIGSSGQIGWELTRTLMPFGQVVTPKQSELNLAQPELLGALVNTLQPDVIVNAAAYTAVDKAEQQRDLAFAINAVAPGELAKAARRHNALLVHYSTDYVFDGKKPAPYLEDDAPNPLNVYGRSKLAGDEAIRASGADHLILRTSWVYAARGTNFLKTILRLAGEREELRIVADQFGAPTWARLVAEVTALALHQDLPRRKSGGFDRGIFNVTAAGETSWHGIASAIVSTARERGATLKCRNVVPITSAEYPVPAARSANSRLSGGKLAKRYGLEMPGWDHCMHLCLEELFP